MALNLKEHGMIMRESDLDSGHPLGQCCDRIQNNQEIPGSTKDVLWWLLRCGGWASNLKSSWGNMRWN